MGGHFVSMASLHRGMLPHTLIVHFESPSHPLNSTMMFTTMFFNYCMIHAIMKSGGSEKNSYYSLLYNITTGKDHHKLIHLQFLTSLFTIDL